MVVAPLLVLHQEPLLLTPLLPPQQHLDLWLEEEPLVLVLGLGGLLDLGEVEKVREMRVKAW